MISETSSDTIAIIGMACRFPDADNLSQFWLNLTESHCALRSFTDKELTEAGVPEASKKDPAYVRAGYILDRPLDFDAGFFGFNTAEAERMDPQHRLFLETVWTAFEHAGQDPERFEGEIGIFASAKMSTYHLGRHITRSLVCDATGMQSLIASDKDYVALRAAYAFNLKGPAVTVQSACSSSLVAVHMACESLLSGGCDMAVAGAAAILHPQTLGYRHQAGMILSPDGLCRAFDAEAKGMAAGNGVGAVILRRHEDAARDGDPILALIRGSAMNNDGRNKAGFNAPAAEGQRRVIRDALDMAGIPPDTIGYVETHGTGTEIGDPIEVSALTAAFGPSAGKPGSCAIGSVKTNIGHLDTAAGIAGLIKTVLCLRNSTLVPSLHFKKPNPEIDFAATPFHVNTQTRPWESKDHPRRAGVSSFGIGGTNVHLVLEEAPVMTRKPAIGVFPLILSARTKTALLARARDLADFLDSDPAPDLAAVSRTLAEGRRHFSHRLALASGNAQETARTLRAFANEPQSSPLSYTEAPARRRVLAFTGQGSLVPGAAARLVQENRQFKKILQHADFLLKNRIHHPVSALLTDPALAEALQNPSLQQPAHFALSWALWEMWQDRGFVPDLVTGHSIGMFPAAAAAGALGFEEALLLVAERGRLTAQFAPAGKMLSIAASEDSIRPLLAQTEKVFLSAHNGPAGIVVAGREPAMDRLTHILNARKITWKHLPMDRPFHTPEMEEVGKRFARTAAALSWRCPTIPLIQDLYGTIFSGAPENDYWCRHFTDPVRFDKVMDTLEAGDLILEIGGRPILSGLIRSAKSDVTTVCSLRPAVPGNFQIAESTAILAIHEALPASALLPQDLPPRTHLPCYPFERKTYTLPATPPSPAAKDPVADYAENFLTAAQQRLAPLDPEGLAILRPEMEKRLAAYVSSAFRTLVDGADVFLPDNLRSRVPPIFHPLLQRLITALIRNDVAVAENAHIRLLPIKTPEDAAMLAAGLNRHPAFGKGTALFEFLHHCGISLPLILSGQMEPRELLFPGGGFGLLDQIYRNHPQADALNGLIADVVAELTAIAPSNVPLTLTEIGAGTGATTAALLQVLPAHRIRYRFTDISPLFLDRACERFGDRILCGVFDLTRPPESQDIPLESQDIIVAANSLHTTPDIRQALMHTAALLRPGGLLILREMTRPGLAFDLTFGSVMPPFAKEDPRTVLPYLSPDQWRQLSLDCGLSSIAQAPETDVSGLDEHVMLFRKPGNQAFGGLLSPDFHLSEAHPLLGSATESPLGHREFSTHLDPIRLPFLRDHRIHGVSVLPGTAFMELLLSLSRETGTETMGFRDLVIHRPILPRMDGSTRLTTVLEPLTSGHRVRIFGRQTQGWELHGEAVLPSGTPSHPNESSHDLSPSLSQLAATIRTPMDPENFYCRFRDDTGLVLGAGFQGIRELFLGKNEGLARLILPSSTAAPSFVIHPALLDAGLQVIWAARIGASVTPETVFLPMALDQCDVLDAKKLSSATTLWCHGQYEEAGSGFIAHLRLFHTDGSPLLLLSGLHSVPASKEAMQRIARPASFPAPTFWDLSWNPLPPTSRKLSGLWFLVPDAAGRFMAVETALHQAGATVFRLPQNGTPTDWIREMSGMPEIAGFLLPETPNPTAGPQIVEKTAWDTVNLIRTLATMERPPGRIVALTRDAISTAEGEGTRVPEAVRAALFLTAAAEFPSLCFQVLDLPPLSRVDEANHLVTALSPMENGIFPPRMALREKKLLVPTLISASPPANSVHRLDPEGLYVVTGGLGGAGATLIRRLHHQGARRIAIFTRHPETRSGLIKTLRALPALNLSVHSVDCGEKTAVDAAFDALETDGIPVRGIFHLAGLLRETALITETEAGIHEALRPKLSGAWHLHTRTLGLPLDHFVLFSSIAALWGSPGIGAYAAANAGLDALAAFRRHLGLPGLSVRWGEFSDAGMLAKDEKGRKQRESMGVFSMTTETSMENLMAILEKPPVTVTFASLDKNRLAQTMALRQDLFHPPGIPLHDTSLPSSTTVRVHESEAPAPTLESITSDLMEKLTSRLKITRNALRLDDDLLTLGMDSLMFIDLADALSRSYGIRLRPHRLLTAATPKAITSLLAGLLEIPSPGSTGPVSGSNPGIPPRNLHQANAPFPLTDIQQAYWVGRNGAFRLGNIACHSYFEMECDTLDTNRYETAWNDLIVRHPMLQAVIRSDGRQEIPAVTPRFSIPVQDLREMNTEEREKRLVSLREEMGSQILDTATWPLFDVRISLLPQNTARIHIDIDMLVADIHSIGLMIDELARLYENPVGLDAPPSLTFRDYVLQQESMETEKNKARRYWMNRLPNLPPAPELPLAVFPEHIAKSVCIRRTGGMSPKEWKVLKTEASHRGLTPSSLLLSAFCAVIGRWSRSRNFTLNITRINRPASHPEIHRVVGDFTSAILLAVEPAAHATFTETALALQQRLWEDMEHSAFSAIAVQRERSRQAEGLTEAATGVVFTSALGLSSLKTNRLTGERLGYGVSQTPQVLFDHQIFEMDGALAFNWDTVDAAFPQGMLDAMFQAYTRLLSDLVSGRAWDATHPVPLPEGQALLRSRINATDQDIPTGRIHDGVIRHAENTPDAPALFYDQGVLSYKVLHEKALSLAALLLPHGIRPDEPVGVMLPKGPLQAISILAVLYAGAPYLPLDPATPEARLTTILKDSGARVVLADGNETLLPPAIVCINPEEAGQSRAMPAPADINRPDDLAYIIFTSGSTGRPKGVAMEHRSTVNTIRDIVTHCGLNSEDRSLCLSSHTFDLSVFDLFGIWEAGGAVVLPSSATERDPAAWIHLIRQHNVTLWNTVPTLMEMLTDYPETGILPLPLRYVLLSGDRILPGLPDKIRSMAPEAHILALGGATEAAIWSIYYPVETVDPTWKTIPYGRPLSNQRFHVLDADLLPAPDWVTGDLYIAGIGLAREYWKDPEQTEKAFLLHPGTGERLYRTGDLGRYRDDGVIEILGREDAQVKVNGYRIELGEVEAALRRHPGVSDAAAQVVGTSRQGRRLVGYVVPEPETDLLFLSDESDRETTDKIWSRSLSAGFRAVQGTSPLSAKFREAWSRLETLHDQSLRNLMATQGFFTEIGERQTVSGLMVRSRFRDRYEKWLRRGLLCLVRDGWLAQEDQHTFRALKAMTPVDLEPEIQKILDNIKYFEGLIEPPQMGLMFKVARQLAAVLREDLHSAELYASEEAKGVYRKLFRDCNQILLAFISATVENFPGNRPLRVLEVGAGHGGTTGIILDCFKPEATEYIYTDISDYFLENAAEKFRAYPFLSYRRFDLNLPPEAQGLPRRYYDLVVASSVLHDTRDIAATLRHLETVTAPGGILLVTEETRFFRSFDLQMGVQQGFDVFTDTHFRQNHPLADRAMWNQALGLAGFTESRVVTAPGSTIDFLGFDILAARMPSVVRKFDEAGLAEFLTRHLPAYMVPGRILMLESLPVSTNGKIDRKRLPIPNREMSDRKTGYAPPETDTQTHVIAIWRELLKNESLGIHDNVFAAGGDSLMATRAVTRLQQHFGIPLTVQHMYSAPTVALLSAAIDGMASEPAGPVRRLRSGGSAPPLFCLHEAAGSLNGYRHFPALLPQEIPLFGLIPAEGKPVSAIPQAAAAYIQAIRKLHPQGPYHIAGFCMGGVIAQEMARQLEKQGETVRLALLDSVPFPSGFEDNDLNLLASALSYHRIPLARFGLHAKFTVEERRLGMDIPIPTGQKAACTLEELDSMPHDARIAFIHSIARASGDLPEEVTYAAFKETCMAIASGVRALLAHTPGKCNAPALFIRASEPEKRADPLPYWEVRHAELAIINAGGDHFSMMEPPHINTWLPHLVRHFRASALAAA
ncbi:non-ribosomal peptide synthetase/type I polyketide synthase [Desulfobotulus sp.]|uniref:non-ribosomal peptide synthetase/type I polyketide synthase n=1 Tax=Desulfobotulus sp. TaxID=1940337 RepID=UPI002A36B8A2|nr:non-ribosomal peptide synthetase/type I polyketide synthase [Desulfobotulus sp.]MDY0163516.1 amino acid adenylation domain-containing protein [Desulfobotulus sp.]